VKIKRLFFSIIRFFRCSNVENEKLLVIHVMKTAGTSFRGMLEDYYGPKMVYPGSFFLSDFPFGWYPKGDEILKAYSTLPTHKVLIGHFAFFWQNVVPFSRWMKQCLTIDFMPQAVGTQKRKSSALRKPPIFLVCSWNTSKPIERFFGS